jgi:putative tryptophan/tyrosine transport system substrate-binding protein
MRVATSSSTRRLGGAAVWPIAAGAQQPDRMRRIDVLMGLVQGDPDAQPRITAFEQALHAQPWSKEHNLRIVYHWGAGDAERAGSLAKEAVEQRPDVIVAHTTPAIIAVQRETHTIPIVFVQVTDPVAAGLVASLARPGGNATGFTNFDASLGGKWLELLKEIAPRTAHVALLYNPEASPFAAYYLRAFEAAGPQLSVQPIATPVRDDHEIEGAITAMGREPGGGLIVAPDIFTATHRQAIISLAARHRVPSVYPFRYWAVDGGLVSYGVDSVDPFQQAAGYVDRILRGEKPGDLPVQRPTKFEFVINLKTAKALGLTIPETLLAIADKVIE